METSVKRMIRLFTLFCIVCFAGRAFAVSVTDVTEGKINGKTSVVVSLDGVVHQALDIAVVKDKKRLSTPWILSPDRTYQYLPIGRDGVGEYAVSLNGIERGLLDQVEYITIYEAQPSVRIIGQGPFINATGDRAIPIESVNASGALVSIYRVDNMPKLFSSYFYSEQLSNWTAQRLRKNFTHQTDLSFKFPPVKENETVESNLTLPDNLSNGWYILAIKPTNSFERPKIFHVLLSDIGVQGKVFANKVSLQAVDLASNRPLAKGKVTIVGKNGIHGTGHVSNGFVQMNYSNRSEDDVFVIESQHGLAVLPMKEVPLDLSDFKVAGLPDKKINGFVFSNRNLFKPSEKVKLNVLVRKESGDISSLNSVFVKVVTPDGKVALSRTVKQSIAGFFNFDFTIPASAKLGKWSATILANKTAKQAIGTFNFNVAEFVPERMDLTLSLPASAQAGEAITGDVNGRYLYGQPADGNKLTIRSTLQSITHFPGKYQNYFVGTEHYISSSKAPETVEMNLDKQGHGTVTLTPIEKEALEGPAMLTINNQLFETGGATTTRVKKVLIANGQSIVGIKPASDAIGYYTDAKFSLLLLNETGDKTLSDKVTIRVERNTGGYYWVFNESSGWDLRQDNKWRVVKSSVKNLKQQGNVVSIPVRWGDYRITAIAPSGQKTVYNFEAGWDEENKQIPVKPDQLAMKLDKENYLAGEYITVDLSSPIDGLVTLELVGDKTYQHATVDLKGKTQVRLKIPQDLQRYDLYLVGTLVNSQNSFVHRSLAVAPIKLYRGHRHLDVSLVTPEKLQPFTTQTVKVKVKGHQAINNGYVVLTVADKGIINMSRYKVPNLFDWFYGQKRFGADIVDLYSRQFKSRPSSFIRHRYGGDEDLNSSKPMDNLVESKTFNTVLPPVKLNSNGEAEVQLHVPDYNGEVQMVATVFDGNKFGQNTQDVTVSAPIVAELSVPRFFATDSQSQVMVEASNQTKKRQRVTLSLSAENGITLQGDPQKVLMLSPGEKGHFAVPIEVGNTTAMSTLQLSVDSADYTVQRNWRVPVRTPSPYVSKKSTRVLRSGDVMRVSKGQWNGILPVDQGISAISFSRVPEIEPTAFVQGLFRYPYGCVEQTTSTAYPWLLDDSSLLPLKEKVLQSRSVSAKHNQTVNDTDMLQRAVMRLSYYQNAQGGFGLWGRNSYEEKWLTAYVASFLFDVKAAHPNLVNQDMLDKLVQRLHYYLYNSKDVNDLAYAGYVLSREGLLSFSDAKSYLKNLNVDSSLSNAYLGATFYRLGDMRTSKRYFAAVDDSPYIVVGSYYDSAISSYSKLVSIVSELEQLGPINPQLSNMRIEAAKEIFNRLNRRRYFSTQEKYALAKAGFELQALNQHPVTIAQNGYSVQATQPFTMKLGDTFNNDTAQPIYVTESIDGYADPDMLSSSIAFKEVDRDYFNENGLPINSGQWQVGQTIVARVSVRLNENVDKGMLVDYLPAGLVLENPDFTDSKELLESLDFYSSDVEMEEFRNDRYVAALNMSAGKKYTFYYVMRAETKGVSEVPNVYIEDMYAPERFVYEPGSTETVTIK
ncbi:alpha-2-macroglobulin family protein [Vibrio rarus]|uniref:alpha-2-macroglobulin family protein n=1 Tax=Vibrio rarus TaxID=413403 RepID=UPI0021C2BFFB|nr:MG2 domain-containing protein [Vibrio rarus]